MFIVRRKGTLRVYQNKKNLIKQLREDIRNEEWLYHGNLPEHYNSILNSEIIEVKEVDIKSIEEFLGQ